MGIFKAYDVRGIYNQEWNKETVYRIGYFLPDVVKTDKFLVTHDARLSSPEIFEYLCEGLRDRGVDVYYGGFATTPMSYFATSHYKFEGAVQITASHNPPEYNGLKISRKDSLPVGYESGLRELESLVISNKKIVPSFQKGKLEKINIKDNYVEFMKKFLSSYCETLSIGIDCSNGMTAYVIKEIFQGLNVRYIYDEIDGRFPNHPPNPLVEENLKELKLIVKNEKLDLGIIFDGDGDRAVFVDNKGKFVRPDLIIPILGRYFLRGEKGVVLHDIRTSRSVIDYIHQLGGKTYMWKVGHAYAKVKLREIGGIFGGELAGHYYFRDFFYCDSGILASIFVLNELGKLMREEGLDFSSFIASVDKYCNTGEVNFRIEEKDKAIEEVKARFLKEEGFVTLYDFDGYRIEFKDWWFNIRKSNTEPYLRLIVEASSQNLMEEKLNQIKEIIIKFS